MNDQRSSYEDDSDQIVTPVINLPVQQPRRSVLNTPTTPISSRPVSRHSRYLSAPELEHRLSITALPPIQIDPSSGIPVSVAAAEEQSRSSDERVTLLRGRIRGLVERLQREEAAGVEREVDPLSADGLNAYLQDMLEEFAHQQNHLQDVLTNLEESTPLLHNEGVTEHQASSQERRRPGSLADMLVRGRGMTLSQRPPVDETDEAQGHLTESAAYEIVYAEHHDGTSEEQQQQRNGYVSLNDVNMLEMSEEIMASGRQTFSGQIGHVVEQHERLDSNGNPLSPNDSDRTLFHPEVQQQLSPENNPSLVNSLASLRDYFARRALQSPTGNQPEHLEARVRQLRLRWLDQILSETFEASPNGPTDDLMNMHWTEYAEDRERRLRQLLYSDQPISEPLQQVKELGFGKVLNTMNGNTVTEYVGR